MKNDMMEQVEVMASGCAEVLPADGLKAKVALARKEGRPLTVKLGVDPTAPDLHLGHAVPLRKLRQFQDLGHKAVLIIGDFTAKIGDPSGRLATRPPLTDEQVAANAKTYTDQAFKILDANPKKLEIVYNSHWLAALNFADILGLTSKFTVAGLLVRDDFMKRYKAEQSIGLHEFLYPVMQAYDSVEIGADVELGGTDQKFNLLAGRELQEKSGKEPQVALTLPLLEGTDGVKKMSKSYDNHIGLTFEPADMFGKVMSVPDEALGQDRFHLILKYYQLALGALPDEVADVARRLGVGTLDPRDAKAEVARRIVETYHGPEAAEAAKADFEARFRGLSISVSDDVSVSDLLAIAKSLAEEKAVSADLRDADGKVWMPKLLVAAGAASSTSDGRRLMEQGGVKLNGEVLTDPRADVAVADGDLLEVGKRKKYKLSFTRD